MSTPIIPDSAPFDAEQRQWLNGFLAGVFAQANQAGAGEVAGTPLTVAIGTQTGNSEAAAKMFGKVAKTKGFDPKIVELDSLPLADLAALPFAVIITSTFGDGEPPASAAAFHAALMADDAPAFGDLKFAVCGLGDTNYPKFCQCAKDIDARLEELGAVRIADRVDCDVDYEEPLGGWIESVFSNEELLATAGAASAAADDGDDEVTWSKTNPFPATLLDNHNLNGAGSAKETTHVAICQRALA